MLPYSLSNFEIKKYYQNDAQLSSQNRITLNGVYSKNVLPNLTYGVYVKKRWSVCKKTLTSMNQ